ncbi:AEC family transporter [Gemella sp. GH3]|uniref:AEC family transporter n=1 Tax=unclassified Gemella TaxID=2624949 RepID=UPI0015CFF465|nr:MULTISPECIES: AEC family transporter [unclassified Gemella]MBF0713324.1 AEC family transporter [Gemella sp. GH3.1]NYS50276.1 AEC family transporter [Gemella sp. GH3]
MGDMSKIILSNSFLGAIFSTISIILIGYYIRKKNIVGPESGKVLSNIMLSVTLPALAFQAFMVNITKETFTTGLNVFIFGFVAYVILIVLGELIFFKQKGDKKTTLSVLTTFGSTTFFGIPIINGFLGTVGTLYANIFNIAYRVFLYSYGLVRMSGTKFEKKNLKAIFGNPIIIATFAGLIIWIFQGSLPQVNITENGKEVSYAFLRIDKTVPWVFAAIKYLSGLSSPLAWLAIGITLGNIKLGDAVKDKLVWFYVFAKLMLVPAIFVVIIMAIRPILPMSYDAVMAIIIMLATPPATVAVAYAIKYEREQLLASNASLLATVLAVAAIIFWIVVGTALKGFF